MTRLRILVVSPDLPYPPSWGFGMRVYQILQHLGARHEITLVTSAAPGQEHHAQALREVCDVRLVAPPRGAPWFRRGQQLLQVLSSTPYHAAELISPALQRAVDSVLGEGGVDIVQLESSRLAGLRLPPGTPLVVDEHNIESELLARMREAESSPVRRLHSRIEAAKQRSLEQRVWARADGCAVTSEREEVELLRRVPSARVMVVPNGVDPVAFAPIDGQPAADEIVFNGLLSYRPNLDAARYLVKDLLPAVRALRPTARAKIVGYGPEEELRQLVRPGVSTTGWVDDVRPHVGAAACVLVPLRMGSGTRLKILEALSLGRAVVTTSVGCEGISVRHGEHLLIADGTEALAAATAQVLEDGDLRRRLGAAGRRLVVENYGWERSAVAIEELHLQIDAARKDDLRARRG